MTVSRFAQSSDLYDIHCHHISLALDFTTITSTRHANSVVTSPTVDILYVGSLEP